MPIDYSELRKIAEHAKTRGLIAHVPSPTRNKRTEHKRARPDNPLRSNHHWVIVKIACPACGATKGERCKPTIGLTEDIPVHASRIHEAERN